jgi:hypothetical protein
MYSCRVTDPRRVLIGWDHGAHGIWWVLTKDEREAPTPPGHWSGTPPSSWHDRPRPWSDRLSGELLDDLQAWNDACAAHGADVQALQERGRELAIQVQGELGTDGWEVLYQNGRPDARGASARQLAGRIVEARTAGLLQQVASGRRRTILTRSGMLLPWQPAPVLGFGTNGRSAKRPRSSMSRRACARCWTRSTDWPMVSFVSSGIWSQFRELLDSASAATGNVCVG